MEKVVLDPGHGVETAGKRSPDGAYLEHEFTLDMARRIKALLEAAGVEVVLTRQDEHDVPLSRRAAISNDCAPRLFVSLHSNAAGSGAGWLQARGYGVYTSAPGDDAGRNRAARCLLERAKQAGFELWGGRAAPRPVPVRTEKYPRPRRAHRAPVSRQPAGRGAAAG